MGHTYKVSHLCLLLRIACECTLECGRGTLAMIFTRHSFTTLTVGHTRMHRGKHIHMIAYGHTCTSAHHTHTHTLCPCTHYVNALVYAQNVDGKRQEDGRYARFTEEISAFIPKNRQFTDPVRTFAYGTDASFYRLNPKLVVKVCAAWSLRSLC